MHNEKQPTISTEPIQRVGEDLYKMPIQTFTQRHETGEYAYMLDAKRLIEIYDYCLRHMNQLEADAAKTATEQ